MKKIISTLICAAMVAAMLVGCGSKADGKTWIIATDTVFKPFEYTDASGNFVVSMLIFLQLLQKIRDLAMIYSHLDGIQVLLLFRQVRLML